MSHKRVVMKGGNGKTVSVPAKLADGLVKMRRATYYEADKPKAAPKAAKPEAKRQTYATREMTADKPQAAAKKTLTLSTFAAKPAAETPKAKPPTADDEA